jgi:uncharacterized membrane protein
MTALPHTSRHDPVAHDPDEAYGERRWPMAAAVIAAAILTALSPDRLVPGPRWLLPAVECLLLLALMFSDPGRISRRSRQLRRLSIALVCVLVATATWATGVLVHELVVGGPVTDDASELLETAGLVWLNTIVAFALLFWELDTEGAAARARHTGPPRDFAFPQQLNPDIAPGWRPRFGDYLYLGLTNSIAFSPTDAMPLSRLAKASMAIQSVISLALLTLVVARAVNIFN